MKAIPNWDILWYEALDPKLGELILSRVSPPKGVRRPEPVFAAINWDDLRLGAICQSNPEIAGSPRNIFRYSGIKLQLGGRALNGFL